MTLIQVWDQNELLSQIRALRAGNSCIRYFKVRQCSYEYLAWPNTVRCERTSFIRHQLKSIPEVS